MIGQQHTVTTSPTLIIDTDSTNRTVVLHAIGNGVIYLGGATVTTSQGFYLDKAAGAVVLQIPPGEKLYGIVTSGTDVISTLLPDA
ncbi:hypothetical protein UFOVP433_24 [uncultured Caudovirales phage]|uniref:Uncharacterized protein n=1 Tax=uncultured Caudovirales phage TaxID=2100421 RepID=A0A6J5NJ31_9CAUD|nr:hypothetical protein UFOVP433_24 [uncultured Caudovirales phage]CAB4158712.1 hypothetical protein UFOVP702_27 [uncultured Caudovirales phage]